MMLKIPETEATPFARLEYVEAIIEDARRIHNAMGTRVAFRPATNVDIVAGLRVYSQPGGDMIAPTILTDVERAAGKITLAEFRIWQCGQIKADSEVAQAAKRVARMELAQDEKLPLPSSDDIADDPRMARFNAIRSIVRGLDDNKLLERIVPDSKEITQ